MKKLAIVLASAACACASLSPRAKAIRQVQEPEVANCKFLQRIDAGYVPHSAAASMEVEADKRDALNTAAAMGATHVVWNERKGNADRVVVTAGAYQCPATAPAAETAPAK